MGTRSWLLSATTEQSSFQWWYIGLSSIQKLQQLCRNIGETSLLSSWVASIARFQCCQCQQGSFSQSPGPRSCMGTVWASNNDNSIIQTTHKPHIVCHKCMWSDLPGSLPTFLHGEDPGYEATLFLCFNKYNSPLTYVRRCDMFDRPKY